MKSDAATRLLFPFNIIEQQEQSAGRLYVRKSREEDETGL